MKAVINAETKCLDLERFRSPTPSINCEIAGCNSRTTPSSVRQTSTPSPAYPQTSTPSPVTPFYPSTGQNQAQENTSNTTYGNAGLLDSATFVNYSNPYVSFLDSVSVNKNHK